MSSATLVPPARAPAPTPRVPGRDGGPVVVAVGRDDDASVRHAAALAERVGAPLHLLHVVGLLQGGAPGAPRLADAVRVGEDVLRAASARAASLVGGRVPISLEMAHGDLVDCLTTAARTARVLVLEREGPSGGPFRDDGTCARVGGRTEGAVLHVPRAWVDARRRATVTVAVEDVEGCAPLLDEALAAAATTGARLRVLHVLAERDGGAWQSVRTSLAGVLAERVGAWPPLDTGVDLVHGRPASAVVSAAAGSELLVVGRGGAPGRLGPVARPALHDAACPVLLAPGVRTPGPLGDDPSTGTR